MKVLHLTLKKKWFDMIASGEKLEEYRELKKYWFDRLTKIPYAVGTIERIRLLTHEENFKQFDLVVFRNGYAKNAPRLTVECEGIHYGYPAKDTWVDQHTQNWYFCIELGKIILHEN